MRGSASAPTATGSVCTPRPPVALQVVVALLAAVERAGAGCAAPVGVHHAREAAVAARAAVVSIAGNLGAGTCTQRLRRSTFAMTALADLIRCAGLDKRAARAIAATGMDLGGRIVADASAWDAVDASENFIADLIRGADSGGVELVIAATHLQPDVLQNAEMQDCPLSPLPRELDSVGRANDIGAYCRGVQRSGWYGINLVNGTDTGHISYAL